MTKYRTKSADVLNGADSLGQKLDWMLFTSEQNAMLWDASDGWKPGDPLFWDPRVLHKSSEPRLHVEYTGNTVRPLFQLFEDDETLAGQAMRCTDCEVSFGYTEDQCWMCGKTVAAVSKSASWRQPSWFSPSWLVSPELLASQYACAPLHPELTRGQDTFNMTMYQEYNIDRNEHRFEAEARRSSDGARVVARLRLSAEEIYSLGISQARLENRLCRMIHEEYARRDRGSDD